MKSSEWRPEGAPPESSAKTTKETLPLGPDNAGVDTAGTVISVIPLPPRLWSIHRKLSEPVAIHLQYAVGVDDVRLAACAAALPEASGVQAGTLRWPQTGGAVR
jgi:hypothetical protein